MNLTIIRIKPNPAGKDQLRHGAPSPSQLAAEWVDFRNDGTAPVSLDGVALYHLAYSPQGEARWDRVMSFSGTLGANEIVRVHAGQKRDLSVIRIEDQQGAQHHLFSGVDAYVWNNQQADSPLLQHEPRNEQIDRTWYAANPPEGVVLIRQGDRLAPAASRAANW